ncbi:MAG: DUF2703 domain-containing protein [Candidatus Deferrimicrobiaceae bacterium]
MRVDVLYFEGCPNHDGAAQMVRRVLDREEIRAEVRTIEVPDPETAQALGFLGSPSIRVNGTDIEDGRKDDPPFYGCRTYTTQGKTAGLPPEDWLTAALCRHAGQASL